MLILAEEPITKEEAVFVMVENEKEEELKDYEVLDFGGVEHELMLHVVRKMTEPYMLKIRGNIARLSMLALIDIIASHYFMLEDVANKLGMKKEKENLFWFCLEEGREANCWSM